MGKLIKINFVSGRYIFMAMLLYICLMWKHVEANGDDPPLPPPPVPVPRPVDATPPTQNETDGNIPCTTVDSLYEKLDADENVTTRNGIRGEHRRWKTFYVFPDPGFEKWEMDVINYAVWTLMQIIPCAQFGVFPQDAEPFGDYVHIVKGKNNGCNSEIGRMGGAQVVNIQSPPCATVGAVTHELLHALGFYHEHNRYDRDYYVDILWDNIKPEFKFAYRKRTTAETTTFGVPYNYRSIMHYQGHLFSKNKLPTMVARNGERLGSMELQPTDIQKLKAMYRC